MSADDEMAINERRKYLRKMKRRYHQADRKERGQLLNEMAQPQGNFPAPIIPDLTQILSDLELVKSKSEIRT